MNDMNGFVWNDCPYITFWNHNKKESQKLKVGIETKVLLDGIVVKKSRFDPVFFQDDKINITVKLDRWGKGREYLPLQDMVGHFTKKCKNYGTTRIFDHTFYGEINCQLAGGADQIHIGSKPGIFTTQKNDKVVATAPSFDGVCSVKAVVINIKVYQSNIKLKANFTKTKSSFASGVVEYIVDRIFPAKLPLIFLSKNPKVKLAYISATRVFYNLAKGILDTDTDTDTDQD